MLRESGTGKVLLCARSALGGTWNVCASNDEAIVTVVATKRRKYGAWGIRSYILYTACVFDCPPPA